MRSRGLTGAKQIFLVIDNISLQILEEVIKQNMRYGKKNFPCKNINEIKIYKNLNLMHFYEKQKLKD